MNEFVYYFNLIEEKTVELTIIICYKKENNDYVTHWNIYRIFDCYFTILTICANKININCVSIFSNF